MKASYIVVAGALGLAALTGCVSVESTKAQLASGNPELIKKANENIFQQAVWGTSDEERMRYIKLTKDYDVLFRIFRNTWDNEKIAKAIVAQMDFSAEGSVARFLNDCRELKQRGRNPLDDLGGVSESVRAEFIQRILSTANEASLIEASKMTRDCFFELGGPLGMKLAETTTSQEVLFELLGGNGDNAKVSELDRGAGMSLALSRLTDQKLLMDLLCARAYNADFSIDDLIAKIDEATICDFIQNDERLEKLFDSLKDGREKMFVARVSDSRKIVKALIERNGECGESIAEPIREEGRRTRNRASVARHERSEVSGRNRKAFAASSGAKAVMVHLTQLQIAAIALLAKNDDIRTTAAEMLTDKNVIKQILSSGKLKDEKQMLKFLDKLESGDADEKLYASVKDAKIKKVVFGKLAPELRAKVREADKAKCEKLIADAKAKGKDTFELGGFYLGMPFSDVDLLVGYYFPEWSNATGSDDGDQLLWVPQQDRPFCRADKSGKVYQLNFGKKFLKKWYNYDVQTFVEWAHKYSAETGVDMRFKMINKDTEVEILDDTYKVWFHQETYQYKHNTKEYRLTYFGEEKDYTFHGGISAALIKEAAKMKFRYVRGDPGSLRAEIERD